MSYHKWLGNVSSEKREAFAGEFQDELGQKFLEYLQGFEINDQQNYWIKITKFGILADNLSNVLGLKIISLKVVEVLRELQIKNFQLFPIKVYKDSQVIEDYYIYNIIGTVEALDKEKSEFRNIKNAKGEIIEKVVKRPVLKKDFDSPYEIFRLTEEPLYIYASERVVKNLKKRGLTGFYFEKA
jgi:hypothetical protein